MILITFYCNYAGGGSMSEKIDLDYINNRFSSSGLKLVCNDCGYKWVKKIKISGDNLEDFEDYQGHDHCPMCGSSDVEECD